MAVPNNILQQVQTYQESSLALLVNQNPWIYLANKKFKNFENFTANLGSSVTFDLPPRFVSTPSLVADFQASQQRVQTLVVDQPASVSYAFTAEQFIFNVDDYMDVFGRSAIAELGATIGSNLALNAINHTYRCFGDGLTPINSYQQYAQALANYRNYGAPNSKATVYVDDVSIPSVVGSGLNQFVMNRNEDIANSWMLGDFSNAEFVSTNLLPIHLAGTVGNDAITLTVTALSGDGSTLTMSGAGASDPDALKKGDILTLTLGTPNALKFLQFVGHKPSSQNVQVRVTADAASNGAGVVVASIYPALIDIQTNPTDANANVNIPVITAEVTALPSHRAGLIYAGNPYFLAMPMLPDTDPFKSATANDPDTGASLRMYYGYQFGLNNYGFVNDCIWGSTLVDEYAMRIAYQL
jgi:hypothetical protein